jgi:hypothetical protein
VCVLFLFISTFVALPVSREQAGHPASIWIRGHTAFAEPIPTHKAFAICTACRYRVFSHTPVIRRAPHTFGRRRSISTILQGTTYSRSTGSTLQTCTVAVSPQTRRTKPVMTDNALFGDRGSGAVFAFFIVGHERGKSHALCYTQRIVVNVYIFLRKKKFNVERVDQLVAYLLATGVHSKFFSSSDPE